MWQSILSSLKHVSGASHVSHMSHASHLSGIQTQTNEPSQERKQVLLPLSRIRSCNVPGLSLRPNLIHPEYERYLIHQIDYLPWVDSPLRRRIMEFGWSYDYFAQRIRDSRPPFPTFILQLCDCLLEAKFIPRLPNQLIINEYMGGQGISKHTDGSEFGEMIFTISLGSSCHMIFRCASKTHTLALPSRSLLMMEGDSRYVWTHEIAPLETISHQDKQNKKKLRRISLTFRYVNVS
jgi:alkylated DNA repair dioxygenase AlkB